LHGGCKEKIAILLSKIGGVRNEQNDVWSNSGTHGSSKFQAPTSRETPMTKIQTQHSGGVCLKINVWNFSGAWMLELGAFISDAWIF
jgi:hypothetical protein